MLSWIWTPLRSCLVGACTVQEHPHAEAAPAPPPSQNDCWSALAEINSEAEFRCMHEQGATLNASAEPGQRSHRDRVYDALWTLARYHGSCPALTEKKLREFGYNYIWLYPLPHDGPDDCATVCRDAETRESRSFSVGLVLGPESEAVAVKKDLQGRGTLAECGFLELK